MTEELKRWVPVMFPKGPFKGKVNLTIDGSLLRTASEAKELIDAAEGELDENRVCSTRNTGSKGKTKV